MSLIVPTATRNVKALAAGPHIRLATIGIGEIQDMTHADTHDEWLARRAVWQEDWNFVSSYVASSSVSAKLREIMEGDNPTPHRCILVVGVYTSYGIELENLDYLKSIWREAVAFMHQATPEIIDEAKDYWNLSVLRYYKDAGISVDPKEFGFD
ncbi:MAG: hypothetical protein J0H02_01815 [Armatimonadetes bacterium]|nr:hypothetical protein [Armatimonadota bacterium]